MFLRAVRHGHLSDLLHNIKERVIEIYASDLYRTPNLLCKMRTMHYKNIVSTSINIYINM